MTDWKHLAEQARGSDEETRRLIELLAQGKTQAEVAAELGLHRSAVWRRVAKLRAAEVGTLSTGADC